MVIAFAYWMAEAGYNPSEQLYATCTDIDPMVADMAFIQLSLLGIPAKVVTGKPGILSGIARRAGKRPD